MALNKSDGQIKRERTESERLIQEYLDKLPHLMHGTYVLMPLNIEHEKYLRSFQKIQLNQ